jgi:NlpC/P60 family putative phage cell wall peptidase
MTAAASSTEALAPRIVAEARSWIGTPYHHQASLKGVGCDCIGLVRGIWRAAIGPEPEAMPAYSRDWGEAAGAESLLGLGNLGRVRQPHPADHRRGLPPGGRAGKPG